MCFAEYRQHHKDNKPPERTGRGGPFPSLKAARLWLATREKIDPDYFGGGIVFHFDGNHEVIDFGSAEIPL